MHEDVKTETILLGAGALVLFGAAVIEAPYFFYVLLRVFICTISAFLASKYFGARRLPLAWTLGAVALMFNPVLPVRMAQSDWQVINVLTAILFIAFLAYLSWKRLVPRANLSCSISRIKAAILYRTAAELGDMDAQVVLGRLYQDGEGVKKNIVQAVYWYRRAADRGHAPAQSLLAVLYADGREVSQNYELATEWYRKAADQNYAYAQAALGALYHSGQGVPKDLALSAYWYGKAAEQGLAGLPHPADDLCPQGGKAQPQTRHGKAES